MSEIILQDQLLAELVNAVAGRRCATSYSDSYHHNSLIVPLANRLLETSNSELTKLLHRIIRNSRWFENHYRASLHTLQEAQARKMGPQERKRLSDIFEHDRGVRLDVGAMNEAQAKRQEAELWQIAKWRKITPNTALGSHPVVQKVERQQQTQELQFKLTPDSELILHLEKELKMQETVMERRGYFIKGVDADMILDFWAANPDA